MLAAGLSGVLTAGAVRFAVGRGAAVGIPPTADFSFSPSSPTTGDEVMFDASGSTDPDGNIVDFSWDLGDGTTATGPTVSHTYTSAGTFDVTLTVTDDDDNTATTTKTVSVGDVNEAPTAAFDLVTAQPSAADPVEFDGGQSSDPDGMIASYEWQFGDGGTGTGQLVSHTYSVAADYVVQLTVTDSEGAMDSISRTVTVLPESPDNLRTTNVTATAVELAWGAPATYTPDHYNVYRDGTVVAQPTTTSFEDTGLTTGSTHDYVVTAVTGGGVESSDSNTVTVTVEDTEAPTAPSNLTVSNVGENSADLAWDQAGDNDTVDHYNVYLDGAIAAQVTGTTHTLTGLTALTDYETWVTAVDPAGNESAESNHVTFTTIDATAPTAPSNLTVTSVSDSGADLDWDASSDNVGVAGYNVYLDGTVVQTAQTTSATLSGLDPGASYETWVTAFDDAGNESADSNHETFTTLQSVIIDSYEDQDFSEYSNIQPTDDFGDPLWEIVDPTTLTDSYQPIEGTHVAQVIADANSFMQSISGLNAYPQPGDTFSAFVRTDRINTLGNTRMRMMYAVQAATNHENMYLTELNFADQEIAVIKRLNGSRSVLNSAPLDQTVQVDTWYDLETAWVETTSGYEFTATAYALDGTVLGDVVAVDDTDLHPAGGYGIWNVINAGDPARWSWDFGRILV